MTLLNITKHKYILIDSYMVPWLSDEEIKCQKLHIKYLATKNT